MTTRSSASTRSRRTTTIPAGGRAATAQHFLINQAKWNELPKNYQAIVTAAAGLANVEETARYDARNPAALKRLIARRHAVARILRSR